MSLDPGSRYTPFKYPEIYDDKALAVMRVYITQCQESVLLWRESQTCNPSGCALAVPSHFADLISGGQGFLFFFLSAVQDGRNVFTKR